MQFSTLLSTEARPFGFVGYGQGDRARSAAFDRYDHTGTQGEAVLHSGYIDVNVPCGANRTAFWYFGDANPGGGTSSNRSILGWVALKAPNPLGPDPNSTPNQGGVNNCFDGTE